MTSEFRSDFGRTIFNQKYRHEGAETWAELADTLAKQVCGPYLKKDEVEQIATYIREMKFIPGGRYLYYAGRPLKFWNNCFLLRAEEDTRQDWADLSWKSESCLMTGGGIGIDYSIYRSSGSPLRSTGGTASGPLPKMEMINEIGRRVMQGGSRRSALYASLNWKHGDIHDFIRMKDWHHQFLGTTGLTHWDLKQQDFNWAAPMDMTNISVNYDTEWLYKVRRDGPDPVFLQNVKQALSTAEPGFSFNFWGKENETLRNACTEVTSADDSDVCNLGSINLSRIESVEEMQNVTMLATAFLICGTLGADVPYDKIKDVRNKNRRLGLGLMGIHEWLIKNGKRYEVDEDLREYLEVYESYSEHAADIYADQLGVSRPKGVRAIAPTGTIGIIAGTTTGIEPIFAVAYKRRYLKGKEWHYQYVIDATAKELIDRYSVDPESIETSIDLAADYERRIKFQHEVQKYVDHAISSTINLPSWGSPLNNEDTVPAFARTVAKYAAGLRGLTVYPDGARGGQPLSSVLYMEAKGREGVEFQEHDVCSITGKGGVCGV
jgi:ribonucleoside-diphosphate reductase alpha chain